MSHNPDQLVMIIGTLMALAAPVTIAAGTYTLARKGLAARGVGWLTVMLGVSNLLVSVAIVWAGKWSALPVIGLALAGSGAYWTHRLVWR